MKDLETMQREGRELLHTAGADGFAIDLNLENLDQHTANTWKACIDTILESGLLEETDIDKYPKDDENETFDVWAFYKGHNNLARDIKEFISKMNSVWKKK